MHLLVLLTGKGFFPSLAILSLLLDLFGRTQTLLLISGAGYFLRDATRLINRKITLQFGTLIFYVINYALGFLAADGNLLQALLYGANFHAVFEFGYLIYSVQIGQTNPYFQPRKLETFTERASEILINSLVAGVLFIVSTRLVESDNIFAMIAYLLVSMWMIFCILGATISLASGIYAGNKLLFWTTLWIHFIAFMFLTT